MLPADTLRDRVRAAYSAAAADPCTRHPFPVGAAFAASVGYPQEVLTGLPVEAASAFAGVSDVSLRAPIREGMHIVDLGCGAGLDSLIAARRTGPCGRVTGFDFSSEMLERARSAAGQCGFAHVRFVQAAAEWLPLADACADLVLVNGLFNLNPYRREIFAELARIVRPGGQVAGAELVLREALPDSVRSGNENWFS